MPDLAILDLWMERQDTSWTIYDALRTDDATDRIPVLICSADIAAVRDRAAALDARGDTAMEKTFDIIALLASVERLLAVGTQDVILDELHRRFTMSKRQIAIASAFVLLLTLAVGVLVRAQYAGDTSAAALPTRTPPPPTGFPPGTPRPTGTVVGTPANLLTPKGEPTPPSGPPATPGPNSSDREGSTAITPTIQTTDPATPAFTAQDATTYALAHPDGMKVAVSGPVTVASVQFLTESQLVAQKIGDVGVAPTRLICVVELHGSFTVSGPPPLTVNPIPLPSRPIAREYFDAHTGNLLEYAVP